MKIRTKLALTLILLQIFGITAISSFSILFIRSYLLQDGIENLKSDTEWIAKDLIFDPSLSSDSLYTEIRARIDKLAEVSGYDFKVHSTDGELFMSSASIPNEHALPYSMRHIVVEDAQNRLVYNEPDSARLYSYVYIGNNPEEAHFFEISKLKDDYYAIIATIRWIIYSGMFISIGIVIIVGLVIARSVSHPILQLNDAALRIAGGYTDYRIQMNRKDEIGTLATSLSQMAENLQKDNERLAALNLRQRQFFGDITHEVRNPLHTLLTTFDMLELDLPQERKLQAVETARSQITRIRQLFEDLSTLARFDEDPNMVQMEAYALKPQLEQLGKYFEDEAKSKSLKLLMDIDDVQVIGDARKIEQVMDNLISNAMKYTQSGDIRVEAKSVGQHVEIRVIDSGIGIDTSHIPHLFERFYRTDKARSRDLGGTGLGLSVVKSILMAHKTDIQVESELGKGSTFRFRLQKANS